MHNIRKGFIHAMCDFIRGRIRIHSLIVYEIMNEPYVNRALMDRVLDIRQRAENNKEILDIIGASKMWDTAIAMPEDELIVCTLAALYKCPNMVFAAMAQDREELLRKGRKNGRTEELS